jgi:nucleoid-associated protein YgaU
MKLFKLLLFISLLTVVSCSNSKKSAEAEDGSEEAYEDADFIVDSENEELSVEEEPGEEEAMAAAEEGAAEEASEAMADVPTEMSDEMGQYTLQKNETLMMVAFKVYGDYRKWKEIRDMNGLSPRSLSEGTVIQYKKPVREFSWNPEGLPYLIRRGDSLVSISKDKYGTRNKWKLIYDNNQPLIRDPSLIFAGFTLYYIPARDLASE